jgi:GT2 family glycosyltransferase
MSEPAMPKSESAVWIIILNWNRREITFDCLDSVLKVEYAHLHTLLVDNGSTEPIEDLFNDRFAAANVEILVNGENLGYTGGNNAGIRYALDRGAEYILLLNNDTVVDPGVVAFLLEAARDNPRVGIVGPKIYYFDEPDRLWFAGNKTSYVHGRPIKAGHLGYGETDSGKYDRPEKIGFVSGCAMLVVAGVFETIGFLDDDYFCSAEDADFCIRAADAGYEIRYAPQAKVWHKEACSSDGLDSPGYIYYQIRNRMLFMKKRFPLVGWLVFAPCFCLILMRRSFKVLSRGNINGFTAICQGVSDFILGRFGKKRIP